nr:thioesterase domain-containing protein [Streptomyces sp. ISL-86]
MTREGAPPSRLFVSGCMAPHHGQRFTERFSEVSDARLVERLVRLGGTEAELLAHPEMAELFLPYIRSDLRMFERYEHGGAPDLDVPMTVMSGDADVAVSPSGLGLWRELTRGASDAVVFPGGHLYLADEQDAVVAEVARRLAPTASPAPRA